MPSPDDSQPTLADLADAIGRGEVGHLTSDVFDTVVWRAVATPSDLFLHVADELGQRLGTTVEPDRFRTARIDAEHRARTRRYLDEGDLECTLEEIWSQMPDVYPADAGITAELVVEGRHLHPHPTMASVLDTARSHGVPVTLVSDIYLSATQLREILTAAGVDLDAVEVVTSADRRRSKWDGLLADVVAAAGGPDGFVHVGDNPISDVAAARQAGVRWCHVDVATDDDTVSSTKPPWKRRSNEAGSDGGRSAVVRETLVAAGAEGLDPSFQFGVAAAGPLMVGFAAWVGATARELGASTIHCLLREGDRIARLIDVVDPEAPERVLVHASRWGIMRAAVVDGTPAELERALARRVDLRVDHVVEAFGCDPADVGRVLGHAAVPRDRRLAAYRALADDDRVRSQIVERAAELRAGAVRYLDRRLRLDDGPLVLCDVGWGGTIQEGITDILRAAGHTPEVIGLYALLSPAGRARWADGADLRCHLPWSGHDGTSIADAETVIRHPEHLERINTPELGTLLEFDADGEPITRADDHDPISASLRSAQRGVDRFAHTWAAMIGGRPELRRVWESDRGHAATELAAYASVIASPDPRVADALGSWSHDDVAGTAHETLTGDGFQRWAPYANAVDAAEISMHDVFWVPGAASTSGSTLAFQIDALTHGGHPDVVCPPSPTGVARIAVFPPGSDLAVAQQEGVPRQAGGGWLLVQVRSAVPGLRSVRIDLGDTDLHAELADAEISLRTGDGEIALVDGVAQLRALGSWIDGRWLSDRRVAVAAGGHLLVDLPPERAADVEAVSVSIAYRTSPLTPDERRRWLSPAVLRTGATLRALRRRLPG